LTPFKLDHYTPTESTQYNARASEDFPWQTSARTLGAGSARGAQAQVAREGK
jgi:hypothetical protein